MSAAGRGLTPAFLWAQRFSTKEMTVNGLRWAAMCTQLQHAQGIATCLDSKKLAAIGFGTRYN
jgi:hypothetical protein